MEKNTILKMLNKEYFDSLKEGIVRDEVRQLIEYFEILGYQIEEFSMSLKGELPESLSPIGELILAKYNSIQFIKATAVINKNYEDAARLRDKERHLSEQFKAYLLFSSSYNFFNISKTFEKTIIFLPFDNSYHMIIKNK